VKLLVLHLSDIHIKTTSDFILDRAALVVSAVKNIDPNLGAVACVLSGDVSWSAGEDEYGLALDWVRSVESELRGAFPKPVAIRFVAVPSNHDCDFTEATEARALVSEVVTKTPGRLRDSSFADICLEPQRRFFQFRDALSIPDPVEYRGVDSRIYAEYSLRCGDATVTFCCCDSAILSELHEKPGTLVFPPDFIPTKARSTDVSIGVIHHPYNWLRPDCMREVRNRLESVTDFILTGHEHVIDRRASAAHEKNNTYLEGGILQDRDDPDRSEFYAVVVDTAAKKQRVIAFSWTDGRYTPVGDDPQQYHLWEDFAQNRFRMRETFQLLPSFSEFLDDPELTLTHRARGELRLSDVYIYPDLKRVNLTGEKGTKIVPGEDIPQLVIEHPCLLLIGDDVSGKTALAKSLFQYLHGIGDVPVYIDAARTKLTAEACAQQLEEAFLAAYTPAALNAYRQLDRATRVVIIDNYEQLRLSSAQRIALLEEVRKQSFRLVVLAHDLAITLHDMSLSTESVATDLPFSCYSILPFSVIRQNKLAEKWLLLDTSVDANAEEFVRNLEQVRRTMSILIGRNYVPAYPPYLLAILQGAESGTDVDTNASTHGYLYELFIKTAIARRTSAVGYNVLSAYLAHIAYTMFKSGRIELPETELRSLHTELHEQFEVLKDFEKQTNQLIEMQLFVRRHDSYAFRHPYIFYYFLAVHLRDHLSEPEVFALIGRLASQLYKNDSASTLLFLAHLCKDRRILEILLSAAASQFKQAAEASLEADVEFLNKLNSSTAKLTLPEQTPSEARKDYLEAIQASTEEEERFETVRREDVEASNSALGQLNSALKTIQILGQLLKNFPANYNRADKDNIIGACCGLGRRVLGDLLSVFEKHETAFLEDMLRMIGRRHSNLPRYKLEDRAAGAASALYELATAGIIIRLSHALGSKELTTTYERVFPELKSVIMRLVYVSLRLEHYDAFPESVVRKEAKELQSNPFSFRVLRFLVARHFAIFPADFKLKQSFAKLLAIDYKKVRAPQRQQKLIANT
jgi:hypothetical protein